MDDRMATGITRPIDHVIKVQVVGDREVSGRRMTTDHLRDLIEQRTQIMDNEGYRLWAMGSRGGSMYMVFAKRIEDGGQVDQAQDRGGVP